IISPPPELDLGGVEVGGGVAATDDVTGAGPLAVGGEVSGSSVAGWVESVGTTVVVTCSPGCSASPLAAPGSSNSSASDVAGRSRSAGRGSDSCTRLTGSGASDT